MSILDPEPTRYESLKMLDLPPEATPEQIKAQYRLLVRIYHPDRFKSARDKAYAEEKLKQINRAYKRLLRQDEEERVPPRLVIAPPQLDFGRVIWGERAVQTFRVDNVGGPAERLNFSFSPDHDWFRVVTGRRVDPNNAMPLEVDVAVETQALEPGVRYEGWIGVHLDDAVARIPLAVVAVEEREPASMPAFLTPKRLTWGFALLGLILITLWASPSIGALTRSLSRQLAPTAAATLFEPTPNRLTFAVYDDHRPFLYSASPDGEDQQKLDIAGLNAVWGPTGNQLAYVDAQDGQVYISSPLLSQPRRMTNSEAAKSALAWSPDGAYLAYLESRDNHNSLQIVAVNDDRNRRSFQPGFASITEFDWAADSKRILLVLADGEARPIYLADIETGALHPFNQQDGWSAVWSTEGAQVAVASSGGIRLLDGEGNMVRMLTTEPAHALAWSPDDAQIAFLAGPGDGMEGASLWTVDVATGALRPRAPTDVVAHAWSPDGAYLAYITGNLAGQPPILYLWTLHDGALDPQLVAELNEPHVDWTR